MHKRLSFLFSQYFSSLFLLFAVHRLLSLPLLQEAQLAEPWRQAKIILVGLCSDIWVAFLCSCLIASLLWPLARFCRARTEHILRFCLLALVALLLAGHLNYIKFFGFPMLAFHLRYLWDAEFLQSNARSLWHLASLWQFLPLLVLGNKRWENKLGQVGQGKRFFLLLVLCLVAHNRNLHWRVQWFIPEALQVHVMERLYLQGKQHKNPEPLTLWEQEKLCELASITPCQGELASMIRQSLVNTEQDPLAARVKSQWQTQVKEGAKPLLLVVLMESFRPSDTGFYQFDKKPSLSPFFDELARSSLAFTQAYSTGSVTRGGQEAILCGHLASRDSSMMRSDVLAAWPCLYDWLAKLNPKAARSWYHGGNLQFDNQGSFWQQHQVQTLLSERDFPTQTPKTSWGVGDISLIKKVLPELARTQKSESPLHFATILSVTHHIPWQMPRDILPYALPNTGGHPSYQTMRYADHALRLLVEGLKAHSLWSSTLMLVVSDHGNRLPSYHDAYRGQAREQEKRESHLNLVLSGGILQAALAAEGKKGMSWEKPVSQVDLALWLADWMDLPAYPSMGEKFLQSHRIWPVLSRLEENLYAPELEQIYTPQELLPAVTAKDFSKERLFYRHYMQATWNHSLQNPVPLHAHP